MVQNIADMLVFVAEKHSQRSTSSAASESTYDRRGQSTRRWEASSDNAAVLHAPRKHVIDRLISG